MISVVKINKRRHISGDSRNDILTKSCRECRNKTATKLVIEMVTGHYLEDK